MKEKMFLGISDVVRNRKPTFCGDFFSGIWSLRTDDCLQLQSAFFCWHLSRRVSVVFYNWTHLVMNSFKVTFATTTTFVETRTQWLWFLPRYRETAVCFLAMSRRDMSCTEKLPPWHTLVRRCTDTRSKKRLSVTESPEKFRTLAVGMVGIPCQLGWAILFPIGVKLLQEPPPRVPLTPYNEYPCFPLATGWKHKLRFLWCFWRQSQF